MKKVRDKMIDFIIVEDNLLPLSNIKIIIDKVMINYDIDYQIIVYDNYKEEIKQLLSNNNFTIYIFSSNTINKEIDMMKYIREELDDWQSLFIVLYKDENEKIKIEKQCLFILDYIYKNKPLERHLNRSIQIALKNYDQRHNTLKYTYKNIFYNIEFWKILYIVKEPEEKKCKIKTIDKEYYIPSCLNKLEERLDTRFFKSSRSYIINLEQIDVYDAKNNILTFHNQEQIDAISRDKKKQVINYLRGIRK